MPTLPSATYPSCPSCLHRDRLFQAGIIPRSIHESPSLIHDGLPDDPTQSAALTALKRLSDDLCRAQSRGTPDWPYAVEVLAISALLLHDFQADVDECRISNCWATLENQKNLWLLLDSLHLTRGHMIGSLVDFQWEKLHFQRRLRSDPCPPSLKEEIQQRLRLHDAIKVAGGLSTAGGAAGFVTGCLLTLCLPPAGALLATMSIAGLASGAITLSGVEDDEYEQIVRERFPEQTKRSSYTIGGSSIPLTFAQRQAIVKQMSRTLEIDMNEPNCTWAACRDNFERFLRLTSHTQDYLKLDKLIKRERVNLQWGEPENSGQIEMSTFTFKNKN